MRRTLTAAALVLVAVGVNLPGILTLRVEGTDVAEAAAPVPVVPPLDAPLGPAPPLPIDSPTPRPTAPAALAAKGPAELVSRVDTSDPVVFLTLDDGLVTDPALARFLARRGVPVTTFLTTSTVTPARQAFWSSMLDVGSVQNHTVVHPTLTGLGTSGAAAEICAANEDIVELTATTPWMLRPPYGRHDATTLAAAGRCGLDYVVLWSVSLPAKFLRYQVGDSLRPGDVILSHFRTDLVPHLKRALREISAAGLRVARLEDYLRPRP